MEKLIKLSPDNAKIRNKLSSLYLKLERYPEALAQAEEALKIESGNVQALRTKGAILRVMGNDAEAQACFEKILSMDPGNYSFLLDLADIHFHRKEYKEAEERIHSYLAKKPNDREAKMLLGRMFAEMGNRAHAIQIFEELSKADPTDTEALTALSELHKEAGSVEKALRTADTLVNLQGKRATAEDITDLNTSLKLYEGAVYAYSSSVRDLWDRNLKLISGEAEKKSTEDDLSLLMGANMLQGVDEESEALFTESEDFFSGEDEEDLFLGDEPFGEVPESYESGEGGGRPKYKDPLDALAEPSMEDPYAGAFEEPKAPPRQSPREPQRKPPAPQEDYSNEMPNDFPPPPPERQQQQPSPPQMQQPPQPPPQWPQMPPQQPPPQWPPMQPPPQMPPQWPQNQWPQMPKMPKYPKFPDYPSYPPPKPKEPEPVNVPEEPVIFEEEEETFEDLLDDISDENLSEPIVEEPETEEPDIDVPEDASEEIPEEEMEEIEPSLPEDSLSEETPEEEPLLEEESLEEEPLFEEPLDAEMAEDLTPEEPAPQEPALSDLGNEEAAPIKEDKQIDLSNVVELLGTLHGLTGALPEKQRTTYSQGKIQTSLESVIDRLKNLTIIKESTADDTAASKEESGSQEKRGAPNGS